MRLAALWALLAAVYLATITIPATAQDRYAGDEPRYLLAAKSWVEDGDLDLTNQYRGREWREFTGTEPRPDAAPVLGRLRDPRGVGVPLAISPAYAVGGARAVEALLALLLATAFTLAAALARRLVPEPWAGAGALALGLSPPALAAATTVSAQPVAALLLAGAALCALKVREQGRARHALAGSVMLGLLPWLDPPLALVGLPVAYALVRWTLDEHRRLVALIGAELMLGSLVFFARLNETLYGGPLPSAAALRTADAAGLAERAPNLLTLWLDPAAGLVRWAPVAVLAFAGAWRLWRSRRDHVAAAIPERRDAEHAASLLVGVLAAAWAVAAFTVDDVGGPWFPGLPLVAGLPAAAALAAWGLRHLRAAGAALVAVTLALAAWALGDAWLGPAEGWLGVA